ncbi:MAG: beta-lactamase family protein [Bacteroidales bacterium]|nr:beta-lactamase family protein [Bacteroidales bacterium]
MNFKNMACMLAAATTMGTMISCSSPAPTKDEIAVAKLDSLFTERYSPQPNPGGTVLIMKGDSVLYENSWGIADTELNTKIDGNTFFNIASVSKQFTAVAIMKLHEEGKLDIYKSIYDVSPSVNKFLPKKKKPFSDITVKDLMAHSSGIPDSRPRTDRNFMLTATDMESLQYMKDLKELNFEPGTQYEYMNPTFQLLYIMIEAASGMPFEQYMREMIFTPAGMEETLYFQADREIPRMAHGYVTEDDDAPAETKQFRQYDYGEETFFATKADGGIYTSTHEFVQWEKALRNNLFMTPAMTAEAHGPVTKITGSTFSSYQNRPNTSYGYGWFIEDNPGMPRKVYHTGDNGGFQIYAGRFPEKEVLMLVFENRNDHSRWAMVEKLDAIAKEAGWLD